MFPTRCMCDFCGGDKVTCMFAHPRIAMPSLGMGWAAGHMAACEECAVLMEQGELIRLFDRSAAAQAKAGLPKSRHVDESFAIFRADMLIAYGHVSRQREPLVWGEAYQKKYGGDPYGRRQ